MSGPFHTRIVAAPVLADRAGARVRFAELEPRLPADLLAGPVRDLLLGIADHSPFLWALAARDPGRLAALLAAEPEAANARIVADQRMAGRTGPDRAATARRLRRNRAEHALLVALCDIGGIWPLDAVTGALSDFAAASIAGALDALLAEAAALGRFLPPDPAEPAAGCGLAVLALGKLGARELNYSSDIDLVAFFDPGAPLEGVEPAPFFNRLVQSLARLLQDRTADGYVHRVDYRLRPDPGATPVAMSVAAARDYYELVGQTWERAAYIKARAVAGDVALGERFLADLAPFVWRKYFDFGAVAEVHALKRQIHAVRGHGALAVAGHDIKLGRGGIREIEFFAQTQQLVFGGKRPALRGRGTVETLAGLAADGWIDADARDTLGEAYAFLRRVEHRLQMVRDEQTQRLPSDPAELARFAKFAGYPNRRAFERALLARARAVQARYARLFEAEAGEAEVLGLGGADADATVPALRRLGFADPERAAETLRGWGHGRRAALAGERARTALAALLPALMRSLAGTPAPDAALDALDRAFARMPAAAELLAILAAQERLRDLFADLLGTAPRLAQTVAFSPHVLDAVIDPAFAAPTRDEAALDRQFRAMVGAPRDHEDFLDRARDAARQMRFVAGAQMLSGLVPPAEAGPIFSGIAAAAVSRCLDAAAAQMRAAHGTVPGGRIAVLAFGRLGSRQLTAESDLDLVVLYDFDSDARTSDGPRPLDAAILYNRLTQRLVAALTAPTRRGELYATDLRLRPGGGQGMIATQWGSFRAHLAGGAEPWEEMALTRARPLCGDAGLCAEADAAIRAALGRPRDPAAVAAEARAMRALVAREKGDGGPLDLKLAPGGLLDLDFAAQTLVLGHGHDHPDLVGRDAAGVLALAGARGLLAEEDAQRLAAACRLLDDAHHWQRLMVAGEPAAMPPAAQGRLAAALGLADARALAATLAAERGAVRAILARTMA